MQEVKNAILTGLTPLEAKNLLNVNLSTDEILDLKHYYATTYADPKGDARLLLRYGLIMFVGLPGSGKTTIANALQKNFTNEIIHLNQDELGRSGCIECLSKYAKSKNKTIILDRCNLTATERAEWISSYTALSSRSILCVNFNIHTSVCKKRVTMRLYHDMKNQRIIDELSKKLIQPQINEGFYKIININDDDDLTLIFKEFDIEYILTNVGQNTLKKFVRTKHIANLGSVSRDDLIWSGSELQKFLSLPLVIEEKIDGANLGIFIDDNDNIVIQNRSHYVSPSYHAQFADIDKWKYQNDDSIRQVIGSNKWIIYGEWVVAKHSIHYTMLPSKFILFDIYDRTTDKFFSRSKVEELINGTTFVLINKIAEGFFNLNQLRKLAQSPSVYYDGPVEGIYVRAFDDVQYLKYRGKIVRSDFLDETSHWTKQEIVKNVIV